MKPTPAQRRQVARIIEKWRPRLYLGEWHFDLTFMKESAEKDPILGDGDTLATISVDPVYLYAGIRIFPEFWIRSPEQREKAIVHELSHCLAQELFDLIRALWRDETVSQRCAREKLERLVQRITHVALCARETA